MTRIALVTDSSATLSPAIIERHGIHVIPLYIHFGTEVFCDGEDLTPDEYIDKLQRSNPLPTTSQPSVGDFLEVYSGLAEEWDAIISIHISSGLSGTVASALGARQTLVDRAAERGVDPPVIHVVDSMVTSVGLELLVTAAARAIEAGESVESGLRTGDDLIADAGLHLFSVVQMFGLETVDRLFTDSRYPSVFGTH